jgi:hypothetical protein
VNAVYPYPVTVRNGETKKGTTPTLIIAASGYPVIRREFEKTVIML